MTNDKCVVLVLDTVTPLGAIVADREIYKKDVSNVQLTEIMAFDKLWSAYCIDNGDVCKGKQTATHGLLTNAAIFNNTPTHHLDTTLLNNGNIFITYSDDDKGLFLVLDDTGTKIVIPATAFNNNRVTAISTTLLNNGNIFITYSDGGNENEGKFIIVNEVGRVVVPATTFNSNATYDTNTVIQDNGNVLILYRDGGDGNIGKFFIVDKVGNYVTPLAIINSTSTFYPHTTLLNNGNTIMTYVDNDDRCNGKFLILDEAGKRIVVRATIFNNYTTAYTDTTLLNNGNVLITYVDNSTGGKGQFLIVDPDGNTVVEPTTYNNAYTHNPCGVLLNNGNIFITYADGGSERACRFIILDEDGNTVVEPITYNNATANCLRTTLLRNGNVVISYIDNGDDGKGNVVIVDVDKLNSVNHKPSEEFLENSIWKILTECPSDKVPMLKSDMHRLLRVSLAASQASAPASMSANAPAYNECMCGGNTDATDVHYQDNDSGETHRGSNEKTGYLVIYESVNAKYLMHESIASEYISLQIALRTNRNTDTCALLDNLACAGNRLVQLLLDEAQDLVADGVESSIAHDLIFSVADSISRDSIYSLPIELIPASVDTPEALLRGPGTLEKMLVLSRVCSSCE